MYDTYLLTFLLLFFLFFFLFLFLLFCFFAGLNGDDYLCVVSAVVDLQGSGSSSHVCKLIMFPPHSSL